MNVFVLDWSQHVWCIKMRRVGPIVGGWAGGNAGVGFYVRNDAGWWRGVCVRTGM